MRHIGLWIPHGEPYCPGIINSPTTPTRMSFSLTDRPLLNISCPYLIEAQNTALGSYENAQLSTSFNVTTPCTLYLTLSVAGTPPFYPTVVVDGVTKLSGTTSSTSMAVGTGGPTTLVFSISPVSPGSLAAGDIVFTAQLA